MKIKDIQFRHIYIGNSVEYIKNSYHHRDNDDASVIYVDNYKINYKFGYLHHINRISWYRGILLYRHNMDFSKLKDLKLID